MVVVYKNSMETQTKQTKYQQQINELEKLISQLKKGFFAVPQKVVSLKGFFKGLIVSDKEIKEAKKSLFKKAEI